MDNIFICFNPKKEIINKSLLLQKFNEFSFEIAIEKLDYNANYLNEEQLCNGLLNMTSIIDAFKKSPINLIYLSNDEIIGIVILEIDTTSISIKYICANKTKKIPNIGKNLINSVIDICKIMNLHFITLHSIPSAVGFYKKMGFKFGYIDDEYDYDEEYDDIPFDTNMFLKIGGKKIKYEAKKIKYEYLKNKTKKIKNKIKKIKYKYLKNKTKKNKTKKI